MTDNEIIKAFKDFLIEQVDGYTDHVETGGERYEFIEKELELLKETDNLINRQQAEIEWLTDTLNATIAGQETLQRYIITAKAEAIKEFAEKAVEKVEKARQKYQRLCKEQGEEMEEHMHIHFNGTIGIINNLLKETVGDNNE